MTKHTNAIQIATKYAKSTSPKILIFLISFFLYLRDRMYQRKRDSLLTDFALNNVGLPKAAHCEGS